MEWYRNRLEELKKKEPLISFCGDDCAVCPRFLAKTREELQETAQFWFQVGWRDHIVTEEEIRCNGCKSRTSCSYMLAPCIEEQGITKCSACKEFECEKLKDVLRRSEAKREQCKAVCETEEEYRMFIRAFYEKEKNL